MLTAIDHSLILILIRDDEIDYLTIVACIQGRTYPASY
jgi:hypothetical protein